MVETTTVYGWLGILIAVGGLKYYYSTEKRAGKRGKLPPTSHKAQDAKKARSQSIGEKSEKPVDKKPKKPRKAAAPEPEPAWMSLTAEPNNEDKEKIDNKEFARQLSEKKSGTNLAPKAQAGVKSQKSVKQSKAQEKANAATPPSTAPSSAAGDVADDDQSSLKSSLNSPELGATSDETPVTSGGINDMLEAPAAGPSVLRVTAPTNPTQQKKPKAPAFEQAESKKARQNRKKAEAAKLQREADEKERKKLAEQQRRTAREAEGRAAKDGSAFMASQAPSSSAWTETTKTNGSSKADLLDTYDAPAKKPLTPVDSSEDGSVSALAEWEKELGTMPDEDEQQRMALEQTKEWAVVENKKKKKSKDVTTNDITQKDVDEMIEKTGLKEADHKYYANNKSNTPKPSEKKAEVGQKWQLDVERVTDEGKNEPYSIDVQDSEWEV